MELKICDKTQPTLSLNYRQFVSIELVDYFLNNGKWVTLRYIGLIRGNTAPVRDAAQASTEYLNQIDWSKF
uniref:Uncharacterized protein n=1 Tax=Romanomermis culicivorax TaxID=13658 RepID=A0A915IUJ2_ROMCU